MREYLPVLIVGAIIGVFSIFFLVAYSILKKQKEEQQKRFLNSDVPFEDDDE